MVEPSPALIAAELRSISEWHYRFASGETKITVEHARIIEGVLRMLAADCERLGEELAVARRWAPGASSFADHFAREKAVLSGVREGIVIDLVPVLEREMARNAALRGGAAS